ncbi:NADH-quinone oxidoreductase subunit NuoE [Propylenella binzhouense]|uniref:NADH-quinone oxidoreductase subunit NuoE n=1 Tax=Propylenella binzhouense TaxID=2555902 RepID=A0A964WTG2_9HYPH|nr:NADH-quinone oxidoreductase subunit NuoE [Propylenella binzhouense]MYZ47810.1 NADH-quinone oxidoreductase subunit NuoE [Propylenella binzhouense]
MAVRRLAEEQPESFAFTAENQAWAERTIRKFPEGRQASAVIPLLWRVQEQEGWVTKPAMESIAAMLGMPQIRVLEVATFYTMFHLAPVGRKAHVQVCGTTPCMLRGAGDLIELCKSRIAPHPHEVTADGALSWEEVECLGACVNAPMVQIFKDTYEDLTPETLAAIIDAFERGETPRPGPQIDRQHSAPAGGPTTLTTLDWGVEEDVREPAPAHAAGTEHPGDGAAAPPGTPRTAVDETAGGEEFAAEVERRKGRAVLRTGTDPAAGEAAAQKKGRPDPTGRSDEAASRAMGARAEGKPTGEEEAPKDGGFPPRERRGRGKKE